MAVSRRSFLRTAGALGVGALLTACGQAPAPTPTTAPKPSEAPKPAAAEPTKPAAAPAAAAPKPGTRAITITYWNGLTGADGQIMDQMLERMNGETGVKVEQQRIPWADLYAKLQVAVPAGEGPDHCLMHTTEIPHFATDGIIEPMDDKLVSDKGFKADDYIKAPWDGGVFQGKRYAIALDVPQHVLYINNKVFKDAGLDPAKPPKTKDELLATAKQMTKGENLGFSFGAANYVWAWHNLLWQNDANVFDPDLKKAAVNTPAAVEATEFWGTIFAKEKVAPPAGVNSRDGFLAHKIGMWIAGSWNFTGLRDANFEFTAAPVPTIFKKPIAWTIPHQYTFPKPKTKDEAKREAAWTHTTWVRDNVVEWTARAGQISAYKKVHEDPKITSEPALKVFMGQNANWQVGQPAVKWVKAENLSRPVVEKVYTGQMSAKDAMEDLAKQINAIPD
jgi:multiple sugar transport system substrate-binding protein